MPFLPYNKNLIGANKKICRTNWKFKESN